MFGSTIVCHNFFVIVVILYIHVHVYIKNKQENYERLN